MTALRDGPGRLTAQVLVTNKAGHRFPSGVGFRRAFLSVVHDFEPGFDTYTEKPGYRVMADLGLDDVDPTVTHD